MRILQINNFEDIRGGSDRVYQLTTRMLLDRGHEVATVACGDTSFEERKRSILLPPNGYFSANPVSTLKNIGQFIYRPATAKQVRELVQTFRPEIAHLHIFYGQLSSSILKALNDLKVPCIMTVHEYRMLCPISTMYTQPQGVCERCAGGSVRHAVTHRCNRNSVLASGLSALEAWVRDREFSYLSHIDHFLMVSEFCRNKHIEHLPEIRGKSSVLYNFVADRDIASSPTNIAADAPFLYAGRISHEKGVHLLCEAFSKRPHLGLRIAGSGPLADDLIRDYANSPNIVFLGKLESVQLKKELASAKFSIVPSEWYENNPMAILESFGVGTPVLGSCIGGIPELVIVGETGLQFPPSNLDLLLAALDAAAEISPIERDRMGKNAISLIQARHTESAYYEKLMCGYQTAISHRHP
ncbi:glycosyltransferase [Pelomonas aquatica]|uniref:Glycosyltransferase n=1 Tax=Pelomonas aquatica TaxID=431058 RepID=A0A9X4LJH7_9BURK|nr:glycosyltransferase [Pelomonas aquatica]MCY4753423.1 glycosyltransferase [Pelomonas aquatica]MDG0864348.1 glycosyltransferase [Pelomonas aquatica]